MSIKPIDLQVNVGQSYEVAKSEHSHSAALTEQVHHLTKESGDKSKIADSRLDESHESERATNRLDDRPDRGGKRQMKRPAAAKKEKPKTKIVEFVENGNLGNIIDIRK